MLASLRRQSRPMSLLTGVKLLSDLMSTRMEEVRRNTVRLPSTPRPLVRLTAGGDVPPCSNISPVLEGRYSSSYGAESFCNCPLYGSIVLSEFRVMEGKFQRGKKN